jgi:enoyl-CoA hydratase/carnithine racemase
MRLGNVDYEKREGIAIMTLDDQPKLNALSPGIAKGLREGFDEVDRDDEVQIAILTGKGRAFCAGADITGIEPTPANMKRFMKELLVTALCRAEKVL